jgi:hypothetical protein
VSALGKPTHPRTTGIGSTEVVRGCLVLADSGYPEIGLKSMANEVLRAPTALSATGFALATCRQNLSGEHIVRYQTERINGPRALTAIPCRGVADAESR